MKRTIALTVSLLVLLAGFSLFASSASKKRPLAPKSYVATYKVSTSNGGQLKSDELQTLTFQSPQNWKKERYFFNGAHSTEVFWDGALLATPRTVEQGALEFFNYSASSAEMDQLFRSVSAHLNNPEYAGTEQVAGFTTYIHAATDGQTTVKRYYAVETGLLPLKTEITTASGWSEVTEAVNVQFRNVSADEVGSTLPVSFKNAEANLASQTGVASEALSKQIQDARGKLSARGAQLQ